MKIVGGKKFDKEKMQKAKKDKQICNSRHKQTQRLNCNFRSRRTQNIKQILGKTSLLSFFDVEGKLLCVFLKKR